MIIKVYRIDNLSLYSLSYLFLHDDDMDKLATVKIPLGHMKKEFRFLSVKKVKSDARVRFFSRFLFYFHVMAVL